MIELITNHTLVAIHYKWGYKCEQIRRDINGKNYRNLYWSGTEESLQWTGYFEGAVKMGYEIVEKILKKITKNNQKFGCFIL